MPRAEGIREAERLTPAAKVERAARKAALSHEQLVAAIREARTQGLSLRAIGDAAGLSHEQVRRLAP